MDFFSRIHSTVAPLLVRVVSVFLISALNHEMPSKSHQRSHICRTHMQDLKDVTNNVHYENYRSKKLAAVTCNGVDTTKTKGQLTKYRPLVPVLLFERRPRIGS